MACDKTLLTALLCVVVLCLMWPSPTQGKRRHRHEKDCKECDQRRCPSVYLHNCNGMIVPDRCGCCSICSSGMVPVTTTHIPKDDKCSKITCSKGKICVLNIQGIPICRCPSTFMCPKRKDKAVCGKDGVTYRSRCHLRITECTNVKKVRVAHKGPCKDANGVIQQPLPLPTPLRRRKPNRFNKQKEKTTPQFSKPRDRTQIYKQTNYRDAVRSPAHMPVDRNPAKRPAEKTFRPAAERSQTYRPIDRSPTYRQTERGQIYNPNDRGSSLPRNRATNKLRPRDRNRKRKGERVVANQRNRDREAALQRHRPRRYRTRRNKFLTSVN